MQPMTVFIVEDSEMVRLRLIETLAQIPGTELLGWCDTEADAVCIAFTHRPQIMVADIQLREGNGMNVLKAVRDAELETKMIILTNFPYPQYRRKCQDAGADYFFDKATEFMKVPEVIQTMAAQHQTSTL
jgi:DNA-binding NarL/FixJ family response regulator